MVSDPAVLDAATVTALLYRRDVALARHRAALGRALGLSDVEVAAVLHLAHRHALTPAGLAVLLDLSSGGATALVQRLERLEIVTRRPHPGDGRSSLIELTPGTAAAIARSEAALADGVRERLAAMDDDARAAVASFLARLAAHSEALTTEQDAPPDLTGRPVPSLWG
jgi:DNA-binding MarR family transcriptional regulator